MESVQKRRWENECIVAQVARVCNGWMEGFVL